MFEGLKFLTLTKKETKKDLINLLFSRKDNDIINYISKELKEVNEEQDSLGEL